MVLIRFSYLGVMPDGLFVRASKTVDLPDNGRPMIPNFTLDIVVFQGVMSLTTKYTKPTKFSQNGIGFFSYISR